MKLEVKLKYYSKGYVVLKKFINKQDLNNCKRELINNYKKVFKKEKQLKNIYNFLAK